LIYLFGSRTDDSKRGGDINLLILSEKLASKEKRMLKLDLYYKIGEQKQDGRYNYYKVFRSIDAVEFENHGSLIDVLNRAQKHGFFESIEKIRQIK